MRAVNGFDLTVLAIGLAIIGWLAWNWWQGRKAKPYETDDPNDPAKD